MKFKFYFELATQLMLQMTALDEQNNNSSAIHTFVSKKKTYFMTTQNVTSSIIQKITLSF